MMTIEELSELWLETCRRADPNDTAFHEAGLIYALAEIIRANAPMVNMPLDTYVDAVADHLSDHIAELSTDAT